MTIIVLAASLPATAQKFSLSTNLADWANFGTANVEFAGAVARHITLDASARVNPWTFHKGTPEQMQSRHQTYSLGMRWWPWNVFSGWWMSAGLQYQDYNHGGFSRPVTEEGDAAGMRLGGGWSLMLTPWLNLDLGIGIWGGYKWYTRYACPRCGKITSTGEKWFILPDRLTVALMFTF